MLKQSENENLLYRKNVLLPLFTNRLKKKTFIFPLTLYFSTVSTITVKFCGIIKYIMILPQYKSPSFKYFITNLARFFFLQKKVPRNYMKHIIFKWQLSSLKRLDMNFQQTYKTPYSNHFVRQRLNLKTLLSEPHLFQKSAM